MRQEPLWTLRNGREVVSWGVTASWRAWGWGEDTAQPGSRRESRFRITACVTKGISRSAGRQAGPLGAVRMVSRCPPQGGPGDPHPQQTGSKPSTRVRRSRKITAWGAVTKPVAPEGLPSEGMSPYHLQDQRVPQLRGAIEGPGFFPVLCSAIQGATRLFTHSLSKYGLSPCWDSSSEHSKLLSHSHLPPVRRADHIQVNEYRMRQGPVCFEAR